MSISIFDIHNPDVAYHAQGYSLASEHLRSPALASGIHYPHNYAQLMTLFYLNQNFKSIFFNIAFSVILHLFCSWFFSKFYRLTFVLNCFANFYQFNLFHIVILIIVIIIIFFHFYRKRRYINDCTLLLLLLLFFYCPR